jgi:hypothetical protein
MVVCGNCVFCSREKRAFLNYVHPYRQDSYCHRQPSKFITNLRAFIAHVSLIFGSFLFSVRAPSGCDYTYALRTVAVFLYPCSTGSSFIQRILKKHCSNVTRHQIKVRDLTNVRYKICENFTSKTSYENRL